MIFHKKIRTNVMWGFDHQSLALEPIDFFVNVNRARAGLQPNALTRKIERIKKAAGYKFANLIEGINCGAWVFGYHLQLISGHTKFEFTLFDPLGEKVILSFQGTYQPEARFSKSQIECIWQAACGWRVAEAAQIEAQNVNCEDCGGSGYVAASSDLYDGTQPCQTCNGSEAYVTLHPVAQNAPETVRGDNKRYTEAAKAAGGVLVIKTGVA